MLSKCANPACPRLFLYLHEGKIFNIEVNGGASPRHLEHYWLCGNCAQSMTVAYEHGRVVTRLARLALMPSDARGTHAA